jgi:hypothetical protein
MKKILHSSCLLFKSVRGTRNVWFLLIRNHSNSSVGVRCSGVWVIDWMNLVFREISMMV